MNSAGGSVNHTTQEREPPLEPGNDNPQIDPDVLAPFNAYSPAGEIEVDLLAYALRILLIVIFYSVDNVPLVL